MQLFYPIVAILLGFSAPFTFAAPQAQPAQPAGILTAELGAGEVVVPPGYTVQPTFDGGNIDPKAMLAAVTQTLFQFAKSDPRTSTVGPNPFVYGNLRLQISGGAGIIPIGILEAAYGLHQMALYMNQNLEYSTGNVAILKDGNRIGAIVITQTTNANGLDQTIVPGTITSSSRRLARRQDVPAGYDAGEVGQAENYDFRRLWHAVEGSRIEWWEFFLPLCTMAVLITRVIPDGGTFTRNTPLAGVTLTDKVPKWNLGVSTIIPPEAKVKLTANWVREISEAAMKRILPKPDACTLTLDLLLESTSRGEGNLALYELKLEGSPPFVEEF